MPMPPVLNAVADTPALAPLRDRTFRMLWLAWLAANMTMWMNDVAAAWLMTTLTTSPVMVALVQTASTLPAQAPLDRERAQAGRPLNCPHGGIAPTVARCA